MSINIQVESLDWEKVHGLIPAIIQNHENGQVLMLGYMNKDALDITQQTGKATFYSRSKQRLWKKGETSGNELTVINILHDCDNDTLLIFVKPNGPCCHLNQQSCFGENTNIESGILKMLESLILQREQEKPVGSYVSQLFKEGIYRIAQKVGEEGVEVALAAVSGAKKQTIAEAADLVFHLLILLRQCDINFAEVLQELERRAK